MTGSTPKPQPVHPPRVAIEPLQAPWLQHEQFSAVKAATSSPNALVTAKKSSIAKVGQELKRARTYVDQQLTQLEKQLVAISDFLDGRSSAMFPAQILLKTSDSPAIAGSASGTQLATVTSGEADGKAGAAPANGNLEAASTSTELQSAAFLVEDDLAADTPCTSRGLWQYLSAYSYFKPIAPEDMEEPLRLEDESLAFGDDPLDLDVGPEEFQDSSAPLNDNSEKRLLDAKVAAIQEQDDFFKERLLAAILPVTSCSTTSEATESNTKARPESEAVCYCEGPDKTVVKQPKDYQVRRRGQEERAYAASWDPTGTTGVLRDVGLVELSNGEAQCCMKSPQDDQVAMEIRELQAELRASIRQTNAAKRKLRQMFDRSKPWLSQQESIDHDNLAKFNALLRRKKEHERKKRLKEKKRMRRDALRVDIASSLTQ